MTALASDLSLDNPALSSQAVFRAVMDALARPGKPARLAGTGPIVHPLSAEALAIVRALADFETPLWVDPVLSASAPLRDHIGFHTGAPIVDDASRAAFALVSAGGPWPDADDLALGTADYPDRSTTLIVDGVDLDGGEPLALEGPGIAGSITLRPGGVPDDLKGRLKANRALFPRGIDILLVGSGFVLGLPRSVTVREA
jgi:alpha-D-ribose 1-methylphosphonate 5-triphosphate synthase subunit PhnH